MPDSLTQPKPVAVLPLWSTRVVAAVCASVLLLGCDKDASSEKSKKAKATGAETEAEESNGLNSAFERMEPGSVVKDLLIPRYDEDKNPSSVLRALRLVIESETLIRAENLSFHLLSSKKQKKLVNSFFEISECHYDLNTSMLRSTSEVSALSENFRITSRGLITKVDQNEWETAQFSAYFLAPVSGFLNPKPSQNTAMKAQTAFAAALMASLSAQTPPAATDAPPAIFRMDPRNEAAEKNLQEFAKQHQIKISPVELPPVPLDTTKEVDPVETMPEFRPALDAIGFACKGGVFLDGKSSVLTLMKQITVRDPLYAMTIAGEVKVFFEEKKEVVKEDKKDEKKDEKPAAATDEKKEVTSGLGDILQITGTGGVAFEALDKDGLKNFASGDNVSYDVSDEVVTLRGRQLVLQKGDQTRLESANPDAWLKFFKKTKDFQMSEGWNARIAPLKK